MNSTRTDQPRGHLVPATRTDNAELTKRAWLIQEMLSTRKRRDTTASLREMAELTQELDELYAQLGAVDPDEYPVD